MEIQSFYVMDRMFNSPWMYQNPEAVRVMQIKFFPLLCLCLGIKPADRDCEKTLNQISSIILTLIIFQRLKL